MTSRYRSWAIKKTTNIFIKIHFNESIQSNAFKPLVRLKKNHPLRVTSLRIHIYESFLFVTTIHTAFTVFRFTYIYWISKYYLRLLHTHTKHTKDIIAMREKKRKMFETGCVWNKFPWHWLDGCTKNQAKYVQLKAIKKRKNKENNR